MKTLTIITGASKGLGFELARQSLKAGDTVLISGTNFIGVTGVTCTAAGKTAPVASYRVLSPTAISAVLPVNVQTGNFIVTNAVGASAGKSYTAGA